MTDVPVNIVDEIDDRETDGTSWISKMPPGTVQYYGKYGQEGITAGMFFVCPCGCGVVGALSFRPHGDPPSWDWNGSHDKPTLTPSILKTSPCKWHGYLTEGVFKPC